MDPTQQVDLRIYGPNGPYDQTGPNTVSSGLNIGPNRTERLSKIHNRDGTLIPINKILILQHSGIFSTTGNQFYSWLTNEKEGFIVLRMQL